MTNNAPFFWTIPDHVRVDPGKLFPPVAAGVKPGGQPIIAGVRWLIHAAVTAQQQATVILPDLLFYQVLWGGEPSNWPANRRKQVLDALRHRANDWGIASFEHVEVGPQAAAKGGNNDEKETESN